MSMNSSESCATHTMARPSEWDERSRSPSPPLVRGDDTSPATSSSGSSARWSDCRSSTTQPSRDVILLGLDSDVDAEKLRTLVTALANMVDARLAPPPQDATVIRDRNTGASKGFGFVKFDTLEDAKRFVYMHAPFITSPDTWLGPAPNQAQRRKRIKIDFSNSERPQGGISYYEQHNAPDSKDQLKKARARRAKMLAGAAAKETPKPHMHVDTANENAGMRDASAYATNMLLLTNLRTTASAKDVGLVMAQASPHVEQVLLLRTRATRASTGCAFVVMSDVEAAKSALDALRDRQSALVTPLEHESSIKTSFADAVVLEEADPFDPTNAAYVYEDKRGRTWRYENEALGFETWKPEDILPEPSSSTRTSVSSEACTPPAVPMTMSVSEPIVSNGTTYFVSKPVIPTQPQRLAPAPQPSNTALSQHAVLRMLNFTDPARRICFLCQRQFRSVDMLGRHVEESSLHRANLDNEAVCRAGAARMLAMPASPANYKENSATPPMLAAPPMGKSESKVFSIARPALQQVGCNAAPAGAMTWTAASAPVSTGVPAPVLFAWGSDSHSAMPSLM